MLVEGRDLLADYDAIRHELGRYQADLLERQEIVVLSKGDLIHDESLVADLLASLKERGIKVRRISSAASQGLDNLLVEAFEAVEAEREADRLAEEAAAAKASAKSGQVGRAGAKR